MPQYIPKDSAEIRQAFLDDIYLAAIDAGVSEPPTQPGTDWHTLGTAVSNVALVLFANNGIASDNADILTARGDALTEKLEAFGLSELPAAGATGKIRIRTTGSATIPAGREGRLPNGKRGRVVGNWSGVADKSEIDIEMIDTGEDTNAPGGTAFTFTSPPLNVLDTATVSYVVPLSGGTDAEDDARKLVRLINRLRYQPGGGNWADMRQIALDAVVSVQDAYVYPALGGPASAKIVITKTYDPDNNDFSRAPSSAVVNLVRTAIHGNVPTPMEIVVQSAADENCDVTLEVSLPESTLAGGNGLGWVDSSPWPPLVVGDAGTVTVTTVTSSTQITVDAGTTTSPVAGQAHIAWWSSGDRKFRTFTITAVSGGTGAWVLTVDKPMVDSNGDKIVTGDYICPASEKIEDYGTSWLSLMGELGPGENTAEAGRIPRALRHPFITPDGPPAALGFPMLKRLNDLHTEFTSLEYSYRSVTTPTVPGSVDTAPNVLRLRRFAIYKDI